MMMMIFHFTLARTPNSMLWTGGQECTKIIPPPNVQTDGWIKMLLGTKVGIGPGPGHIVSDGGPAASEKGA